MRKIIIKESQIGLLSEDLHPDANVSDAMRESIAVWCLINDFRFYNPKRIFGRGTSVANDDETQRWFAKTIMRAYSITEANDQKELFGYNDYDDAEENDDEREEYMGGMKIYRIDSEEGEFYIEVSDDIYEYDGDSTLQSFADGELDYDNEFVMERIKWFYYFFR